VDVAGAEPNAAAHVATTSSKDTSSSSMSQEESTNAPQTAGFAGLVSHAVEKGRFVAPPWWQTSGLLLWFIGVFLARRETGLLTFIWMIIFLICLGDWVQNFDDNVTSLPSWFILSKFLSRTFLLTLHLPGFFIWIRHAPISCTRVNPA
jgi:hypothetical protein